MSSLMPDAEMSEDINVRVAGQATSSGLVVYHLQRVMRDRIALREKILRPWKMRETLEYFAIW